MWWVTLFAVLPWGVKSQHEANGKFDGQGKDPGAPVRPLLVRKALVTSLIAGVLWSAIAYVMIYKPIDPTPVQVAVLEGEADGRDLLVSAQTGSGKTVAYGLAMAPTLLGDAETLGKADAPLALVVAPTRELALQVHRELTWLYEHAGARVVSCVGGMDPKAEARQLNFGAHIVVGTPGRLRDHLERGRLRIGDLNAVVLDEADEMLDRSTSSRMSRATWRRSMTPSKR